MKGSTSLTLVNPKNGNLDFKILTFDDGRYFDHVQRHNYYSIIWITEGTGRMKADFAEYNFEKGHLFTFSLYQPYMFLEHQVKGVALYFHPDFFCIHKHQEQVACNGVLFNNIYEAPYTPIDGHSAASLWGLIDRMKDEMSQAALAQYDILVSYLKIFLITASRIKAAQPQRNNATTADIHKPIIQNLKSSIERDFRVKHSASQYAELLNIAPRSLAKITKSYFNKTITELISERIIVEAKRELYLTHKTVKEIAYELGYEDEHYFSRFFKVNTDTSPQFFRETVGYGRGTVVS
ncbi:MAG TPA: helix-turn-helix domain-containing protein [Ohtaekwangia sp.]|uniref:helix-turn-helix domain-containing protein n=1 Tax=Ohtaekwangia sp. TaxID=2066019 RepID=UPI002F956541